jgi:hypothetical protein
VKLFGFLQIIFERQDPEKGTSFFAEFIYIFIYYLTMQVSSEQILIYNDGLPRQNPNDTGPIVRCPVGHPIASGCDTACIRTRDCSDASYTEMQCLRPLRHAGTMTNIFLFSDHYACVFSCFLLLCSFDPMIHLTNKELCVLQAQAWIKAGESIFIIILLTKA